MSFQTPRRASVAGYASFSVVDRDSEFCRATWFTEGDGVIDVAEVNPADGRRAHVACYQL